MSRPARAARAFEDRYGSRPTTRWWAPGRVNLIGEHVDYCGGCVLPMPIQYGTTVLVGATDRGCVRATSATQPESVVITAETPVSLPSGHWGRFVAGAVALLAGPGLECGGADVLVVTDIPGSGLSSSASLAVALLAALGDLWGRARDGIDLALAAQGIEHDFVGVPCGLMDQAVIVLGTPGAAYLFDCAANIGRSIPLPVSSPVVVVADTGRSRALAQTAYAQRLAETAAAAAALSIPRTELARVEPAVVGGIESERLRRRAQHVVSEHGRVQAAARALEAEDWPRLGALLLASHASLRDDFDVTSAELDLLVELLAAEPGCHGARMTGAGFGGSAVALVEADAVDAVLARVRGEYEARTARSVRAFVASSRGGVRPEAA